MLQDHLLQDYVEQQLAEVGFRQPDIQPLELGSVQVVPFGASASPIF